MLMMKETHIPHENKLGLMQVRPGVFFVLWDFSSMREKRIKSGEFSEMVKIRLFNHNGEICFEDFYPWHKRKAYLRHEPRAGLYHAVLYVESAEGWIILSESNEENSPAMPGSIDERSHASLEFHKKKVGT